MELKIPLNITEMGVFSLKEKIRRFFAYRNGFDSLATTSIWSAVIVMLISAFIPVQWLRSLLNLLSWALIIYGYFRVFSKNVYKRRAENMKFFTWKNTMKQRWTQRKTHKFYRCPKCHKTLRVPKGKGKISITCRNCGEKFIRNT